MLLQNDEEIISHTDLLSDLSGFIKEEELVKVILQRALVKQVDAKIWRRNRFISGARHPCQRVHICLYDTA